MIYLDHASATPVSQVALKAMLPYFDNQFFNPSAPYLPAKQVRDAYEQAKQKIAQAIGAKGNDLVITSGATESNNLAFTAVSFNYSTDYDKSQYQSASSPRVLALITEHDSVRAVAQNYPHQWIKVDHTGLIDLEDFATKLTGSVELVSISLANNELGTIQPLAKVAELISAERRRRLNQGDVTPLYFHSDASQALALMDISVARLGVDMLTLNSGKVYGPKGVGALYLSHRVKLRPIAYGGGQERGLRAGTENVPGVIGFATAVVEAKRHLKSHRTKYTEFARTLTGILEKADVLPIFLGNSKNKLANFCSVAFPGIDAERLIYILEERGILLSTGAACAASKGKKSHVLTAIGLSEAEIAGSLRISLGETNTAEDIVTAGWAIVSAVNSEAARLKLKQHKARG